MLTFLADVLLQRIDEHVIGVVGGVFLRLLVHSSLDVDFRVEVGDGVVEPVFEALHVVPLVEDHRHADALSALHVLRRQLVVKRRLAKLLHPVLKLKLIWKQLYTGLTYV